MNDGYIRRILTLAAARKIRVFWLLPPIQPALQQRCEQSGFDARHQKFVRGFQAEFSNVTVLDGRHANYDPQVFFDPHHLARDGAAVLSYDVAMMLRRAINADHALSRWVNLPAYGNRRIDGPLEDVEQSRVAARLERAQRIH
ncbi:hypothetical protein SAMN05444166_8370 [Singulisphaera sp. GP187]|uniref:hypothetical protein n=1 Tax=Singulisphaera sp. GP187 TaxID=1882752 RepID=UPI000929EC24|nr:hypothetical protein [Singulisphaera sp. GP187]SIO67470.1 hypothetical protein SAMN05444166_8370 [Singulisphaera sp. GP187]